MWGYTVCAFIIVVGSLLGEIPERWVVLYSDKVAIEEYDPYSVVVLDSEYHSRLAPFIEQKKTTLGYISLGEVSKVRSYFEEVEKEGILLGENKNWQGSYFVDLRDPRWVRRVIEELIPSIMFQRFDGLFLDTLDNADYLESSLPGMKQAALNLVKAIRYHYPMIKIMMNRAYFLLPDVAQDIDMELGESVYTDYDFEAKTYHLVPKQLYEQQVQMLKAAQKDDVEVYTLDYWDPHDADMIEKIYKVQRENGFIPYVSTIELDQIIQEP